MIRNFLNLFSFSKVTKPILEDTNLLIGNSTNEWIAMAEVLYQSEQDDIHLIAA